MAMRTTPVMTFMINMSPQMTQLPFHAQLLLQFDVLKQNKTKNGLPTLIYKTKPKKPQTFVFCILQSHKSYHPRIIKNRT